jgi:hypothetical protein
MSETTEECLNEACHNPPNARGLCRSCYNTASRLVREKKTTWAKLEKAGKALPLSQKKAGVTTAWLLDETKEETTTEQ